MSNQNMFSVAIQSIIAVVGAYTCGFYFTGLFHEPTSFIGGLWAVISAIIVLEATAINTLNTARIRIVGTSTGAIISGVYLLLFPFSLLGYGICIAVGVLACHLFRVKPAMKITGITISVVLIVSTIEKELHPALNAGLRFMESMIGIGIAILVVYAANYLNKTTSLPSEDE